MSILKKAGVSAIQVEPSISVLRAVCIMKEAAADTLFVVEAGALRGAFTQRDLAFRVVLEGRDVDGTTVGEVMTSPAVTIAANATIAEAVVVMAEHGISQLPIVDAEGSIEGMVTLRDIFREQNLDLTGELDSLSAYHSADGIGG